MSTSSAEESIQKTSGMSVALVYSSGTMRYATTTFANLAVLLVGITIGVVLAPHIEKHAEAAGVQEQQATPVPPSSGPEQIQPTMTAGSVGAYLLLAHHVQSDELVVNGIDILKLEQGELNLLAKIPGVYPWQVQGIIDDAKKDVHLYQVVSAKPPQPVKQPTTPK